MIKLKWKNCPVYLIYKKTPQRPNVALPIATNLMCRYGPQILQRKDFTWYDKSCLKVVFYCNLVLQKARSDSQYHHEVLGFYIQNSW